MANLGQTRKRFRVIATLLAAVALIAALVAFLPWRPTAQEKTLELNAAKLETKRLESEVEPLRDLPEKLVKARADIGSFYKERFPDHFSAIPETLGRLAAESGVQLSDVKYETQTAEVEMPGLQRVAMQAVVSGDYPKVVRFINAVERSKVFFLVESITLAEEGKGGGVRLQMSISTILRMPAAVGARVLAQEAAK